ncbi:MAG: hypothetical protein AAF564_22705 [Bacteroidota bacterium]
MQHTRNLSAILLLAFCLIAGCASSKKAAEGVMAEGEKAAEEMMAHPLTGTWTYSLDTPQGVYTGVMSFASVDGVLSGTIISDDAPEQVSMLEDLSYDADMSKVKFKFDGGEFGAMTVDSAVEGDAMNGILTVLSYGVDVTLTAARKTP